jgi:tetratricopeptide (TPR) repeat protein
MQRFLERNAHWILLLGGIVSTVVALIWFAFHHGWLTVNAASPAWIRAIEQLLDLARARSADVERLAKLIYAIAFLLAMITGLWKGVVFARARLPKRFQDALKLDVSNMLASRDALRDQINDLPSQFVVASGSLNDRSFTNGMRHLNARKLRKAAVNIERAEVSLNVQKTIAQTRLASIEQQQCTGLVIRGMIKLQAAQSLSVGARHQAISEAAGLFSQVLEVDPTDLDALELRGEAFAGNGQHDKAKADFVLVRQLLRTMERERSNASVYFARASLRLAAYERQIGVAGAVYNQAALQRSYGLALEAVGFIRETDAGLSDSQLIILGELYLWAAQLSCVSLLGTPNNFKDCQKEGLTFLEGADGEQAARCRRELRGLSYDG